MYMGPPGAPLSYVFKGLYITLGLAPPYFYALHAPPVTLNFFSLQLANLGPILIKCRMQYIVIKISHFAENSLQKHFCDKVGDSASTQRI